VVRAKTKGLNDLAKAQLKQKWGTMQRVLSSQSRLEQIVADILLDMDTKPRLMDGHGNAMLVAAAASTRPASSTSCSAQDRTEGQVRHRHQLRPTADTKGETTGEGRDRQPAEVRGLPRCWPTGSTSHEEKAQPRVEKFEKEVKKKFIDEPGQMKLLIVVDKLLTGFDAPSATYLYIDKQMQDHGLFQAICRVNRLDGEDKDYGYIIDYKDLFRAWKVPCTTTPAARWMATTRGCEGAAGTDRLEKAGKTWRTRVRRSRRCASRCSRPGIPSAYLRYFCAAGVWQRDAAEGQRAQAAQALQVGGKRWCAPTQPLPTNWRGRLHQAGDRHHQGEVDHYSKVRDEVGWPAVTTST
jgi:type I restriction enzyme R subunit